MTNSIVTQKDFQEIVNQWLKAESEGELFPVDFDLAWQIAGYSTKANAKAKGLAKLEKDTDFSSKGMKSSQGGRSIELIGLSCDGFKHFCLMARTEQGRQIRQYFIEAEKKWKQVQSHFSKPERVESVLPELSRLEILRMALDSEEKRIEAENKLAIAAQKIEVMAPLAKLGECMITYEKDTKTIGEIAQSYSMGRNALFNTLRAIGFIQQGSTRPYQSHIEAGHCEVKLVARPHKPTKLDPVCVVTMKGQAYIAKKLAELEKLGKAEVLLEKTVALA